MMLDVFVWRRTGSAQSNRSPQSTLVRGPRNRPPKKRARWIKVLKGLDSSAPGRWVDVIGYGALQGAILLSETKRLQKSMSPWPSSVSSSM